MSAKNKFGDKSLKFNFKAMLEKSEMSREQFAAAADIHYTTVGDLVNGNYKRFGIDLLEKICKTLNCDIADLFVWE